MRQDIIHNNTEDAQSCVIVNAYVCIVIGQSQRKSKQTEQKSCNDEHKHLSLDVYDLSVVLVILVFSLLVQVIKL